MNTDPYLARERKIRRFGFIMIGVALISVAALIALVVQ